MRKDGTSWVSADGLTKETQKGHSIVTHGLHSHEMGFVPFDLELYKKDGRTKNDIVVQ